MACHPAESPCTDRDKNRQFAISRSRAGPKAACELTGTKCAREVTTDYRLLTTDYEKTDYRQLTTRPMRDYTKIEAWKLADDLTVAVYQATHSFPREEIYGLTSQLRRASYSVPANIGSAP